MEVLIKFRHGLGDAVQFTSVLQQLRHYHADWVIDVAALVGKHSACHGLCRKVYLLDREELRESAYDRVLELGWHECRTCYANWPSTKVEACMLDVFHLEPVPQYCRYVIHRSEAAMQLAHDYLKSLCGGLTGTEQQYPVALIHYEGNTSGAQKNLPLDTVRKVCERVMQRGAIPVILDWDSRTPLADGKRIHNPDSKASLWGHTGTGDAEVLASLIELSALMIGVDSGPLHAAGATSTPTIGVWTKHHPLHYFGHAENVIHLVPENHGALLRGDRQTGESYFGVHYRSRVYRNLAADLGAAIDVLLSRKEVRNSTDSQFLPRLRATSYGEQYYQEHKQAGLDYLGFGDWQRQYGCWLVESLGWQGRRVLDVGCACGSIMRGLREAGAVVQGIDVNEHMIQLGRQAWPDMAALLLVGDAVNLHQFPSASWEAIHTAQVAEHWKPDLIPHILRELSRTSVPGGLMFCALDTEELLTRQRRKLENEDPTHVCVRPMAWWHERLKEAGWSVCSAEFEQRLRDHPQSLLHVYDWDWFVARKV